MDSLPTEKRKRHADNADNIIIDSHKKNVTENGIIDASEVYEFEDPYGDEYDDEEETDSRGKELAEEENSDVEPEEIDIEKFEKEQEIDENPPQKRVAWRPGLDGLAEGEELEYDSAAYVFYHRLSLDWPCLSFDIIPDKLGEVRTKCPHTCYVVGGTQADNTNKNKIFVMKWHSIQKTQHDDADSEDSADEDEDAVDEDAKLDFRLIAHKGAINRIRCCPQMPRLVSTWSSEGIVYVWDIGSHFDKLDNPSGAIVSPNIAPKLTNKKHKDEGFAMDWNCSKMGELLTGDVYGNICLAKPCEGGWEVSNIISGNNKFTIEDVQWKPQDSGDIFAASSNNGSIRFFDVRKGYDSPCIDMAFAHKGDVNSFKLSTINSNLLVSGDENGIVKVWDIRSFDMPLSHLSWHKKPITSVDWHSSDEGVFAAASLDNSVTFWDLSVEKDDRECTDENDDTPEQLMFLHSGQDHISELKFHRQIPGAMITTACDGFNMFKTCNI